MCRTSARIGMSPNFPNTFVPQAKIKTVITFTKPFQSMTITVFAAGFFALLGGVGGLKDCAMGDTDLFSDENEHLLF